MENSRNRGFRTLVRVPRFVTLSGNGLIEQVRKQDLSNEVTAQIPRNKYINGLKINILNS